MGGTVLRTVIGDAVGVGEAVVEVTAGRVVDDTSLVLVGAADFGDDESHPEANTSAPTTATTPACLLKCPTAQTVQPVRFGHAIQLLLRAGGSSYAIAT